MSIHTQALQTFQDCLWKGLATFRPQHTFCPGLVLFSFVLFCLFSFKYTKVMVP